MFQILMDEFVSESRRRVFRRNVIVSLQVSSGEVSYVEVLHVEMVANG